MNTTSNIINQKLVREVWLENRKILEQKKSRFKLKFQEKKHLSAIDVGIETFGLFLKLFGVYNKGIENAKAIRVNYLDLYFNNLPESFDEYKILHLTDLHIDTISGFEEILSHKLKEIDCDICFWTGDYRKYTSGAYEHIFPALRHVTNHINTKDGIYATLGNHDSYKMVPHIEAMGINLLINESVSIVKGNHNILLTGTDDPHYYPTDDHITALKTEKELYKIALIHSPELFEEAAENAYDLYLCGHTHAGQICLPGGYPPIKNLKKGHDFSHGLWKYDKMIGYTSPGCGVSGLPVRFNSQGEVTVIKLKKSS